MSSLTIGKAGSNAYTIKRSGEENKTLTDLWWTQTIHTSLHSCERNKLQFKCEVSKNVKEVSVVDILPPTYIVDDFYIIASETSKFAGIKSKSFKHLIQDIAENNNSGLRKKFIEGGKRH